MENFKYIIPQGSPLFGIGNNYQFVTLSNCYLLDVPEDSYSSILIVDHQLVNISKRRGGVGIDLSNLRPAGAMTRNAAHTSTGVPSWMERYSNSIREVGQCIAKGENVLTKRGLCFIEDVVPNKDFVWTKKGWVKVVGILNNGIKEVYSVNTASGFSIKTTKDHVFSTYRDGKINETRLADIEVGDKVNMLIGNEQQNAEYQPLIKPVYKISKYNNSNRLNNKVTIPNTIDEDVAYYLGYTYGDGCIKYDKNNNPENISVVCSSEYPATKNKIIKIVKDKFCYDLKEKDYDNYSVLNMHSKIVLETFKFNGILKQKADCIAFPNIIKNSHVSVINSFIAGYFDADGYASGKKKGYVFSSINVRFLKSVQQHLMSVGIIGKIHKEEREGNWKDLYSLCIVGCSSKNKFIKLFETYSNKVQLVNDVSKRDCWLTPYKASDLLVSHNEISYVPDNSQNISVNCYSRLLHEKHNIDEGILVYDEIVSIEPCDTTNTYDLQLESEHLFWCNGFYVHNSGRRGALMLTLSIHHPDVMQFATIKNDPTKVTGANISLRLTKEFLAAVEADAEYELRFPVDYKEKGIKPLVTKMVKAKEVWNAIVSSAWQRAEPGLLMWDNVTENTPADCYDDYKSRGTNPCSEISLSPLDSCRLMVLNLLSYVTNPFTPKADFNYKLFTEHAKITQRLMDDLVDLESEKIDMIISKIKSDPETADIKRTELELWTRIKKNNDEGRRTGTGITALGDTLAALGITYGTDASITMTESIYKALKLAAYESSVDMAEELGKFKVYDSDKEKNCPFIMRLAEDSPDLYKRMLKHGRRNISLTTTAPCGSISLMARTSSGIEPLFTLATYTRRKKVNPNDENARVDFTDAMGDKWQNYTVMHPTAQLWSEITGNTDLSKSPWAGGTSSEISWTARVNLQSAAQKHVCHSISSTINLPEEVTKEQIAAIYETAFRSGCKGITVYRDKCRDGVMINEEKAKPEAPHDTSEVKMEQKIIKTHAPKRPQSLKSDVHHIKVTGQEYFVIVGLWADGTPYEIFAGKNGHLPKEIKHGEIIKNKRGDYTFTFDDGKKFENVSKHVTDDQEAITRLLSSNLRHGADISFLVQQLEKVNGRMDGFTKALARALKKYLKDGTKVTGSTCPSCGSDSIIRENGCAVCKQCGYSACS
jgi:ribonucleoside-diphosphate reductase alpha chain